MFVDIKVGDNVIAYDEYSHDYIEHTIKITSIEYDDECVTETNPKGMVCYGDDLSDDNDETMICTVYESNYLGKVEVEEGWCEL